MAASTPSVPAAASDATTRRGATYEECRRLRSSKTENFDFFARRVNPKVDQVSVRGTREKTIVVRGWCATFFS